MEIEIRGPVGRLVGELEEPEVPARAAAIVCHPHPLHGGTLRNTIVVRTARALRSTGLVTLRFNFRGVEGSEGVHDGNAEVEDVLAVAGFLAERHPRLPLWGAGYSFGSRIIAELARRDDLLERVLLIAFPCGLYSPAVLGQLRQPGLLLLAQNDPFGTAADLERQQVKLPPGLLLREVPGADHFFRGRTPLVEEAVLEYARGST